MNKERHIDDEHMARTQALQEEFWQTIIPIDEILMRRHEEWQQGSDLIDRHYFDIGKIQVEIAQSPGDLEISFYESLEAGLTERKSIILNTKSNPVGVTFSGANEKRYVNGTSVEDVRMPFRGSWGVEIIDRYNEYNTDKAFIAANAALGFLKVSLKQ